MRTVTLGSERLGSGNKMKVGMHGYERSNHDMGYLFRTSMSVGTILPFIQELALPGDTHDINLALDVQTEATIGALFGRMKIEAHLFTTPIRLYIAALTQNALNIGMNMAQIKLPQIEMEAADLDLTKDVDNQQINPSSIFAYQNIRGLGRAQVSGQTVTRRWNGVPYLIMADVYKNYYANKQELKGAIIHNDRNALRETATDVTTFREGVYEASIPKQPNIGSIEVSSRTTIKVPYSGQVPDQTQILVNNGGNLIPLSNIYGTWVNNSINGTLEGTNWIYPEAVGLLISNWNYIDPTTIVETQPKVVFFDLENIDNMRELILKQNKATPLIITETSAAPYGLALESNGGMYSKLSSQEGLYIKCYNSDLFNNWMNTSWIDGSNGINEITAIDTTSGSIQIDQINLATKVYKMMNRIAISGGTYDDWQTAVYDHDRAVQVSSPVYMGGLMEDIVFQEVISTAATVIPSNDGGTNGVPLGQMAGRGRIGKNKRGGKIRISTNEPSYITGYLSITPYIDYSQGNKWDMNLKNLDEFHKPALDEIGFQDLITDQMHFSETVMNINDEPVFTSAGKQPAWINYMTNVNVTRGNFAIKENQMWMTLNRRYEISEFGNIKDLTTYIDPVKFNQIFAYTAIDAQNYRVQCAIDMEVRRKMSAKVMPNL